VNSPRAAAPLDLSALPEALRALAERATPRSYRKGTLIIEEGTIGDTLYIVLAGKVRAYSSDARGREVTYGVYGPGDTFGEMSLDGGPRSANVIADTACTCAMLTRQTLLEHIAGQPAFALELISRVIRRARLATQSARSMALLDVYGRVVQLLESLAVPQADGTRLIEQKLTHAEIAARVGCSREMVSRLMKDLERGGYVMNKRATLCMTRQLPTRW
jgi:CRP/FNR family transcriptional regulator, cyclic AMP receptor protein